MANEQQPQAPKAPVDTRSATQKIADLEGAVMQLYQTANLMARDLGIAKDAIKLLGNKLDSVVQALATGQAVNDDTISKLMVSNNVSELKQKVTNLVAQGFLEVSEAMPENAFVVGREENDKAEIVNPRLQFAVSQLDNEDFRNKIKASKVGDVIVLQEDRLRFVLEEIYSITAPKPALAAVSDAPAEAAAPAPAADAAPAESAPAAPAPEAAVPASTPSTDGAAN